MSRFLKSSQIDLDEDTYRFNRFFLDKIKEEELWELPIGEFIVFDYASAILYILNKENKPQKTYESIKEILENHNIPTYCGLVMQGITILECQYAIKKIRKGKTLYIRRIYND